ncbi:MAG: Uma2 family endonuclease [Sporichthyaceae bacterium]
MTNPIALARSGPYTVAELDTMPDDGQRYEIIDGMLHVSPAPSWEHQEVVGALFVALRAAAPVDLRVMISPFDVRMDEHNVVEPDVLVGRYVDFRTRGLMAAPLLAVEVLSPSTRLYDRNIKKAHYERIGTASYWLLDPTEPGTLEVFELDAGGHYQLVATATGDEVHRAGLPFPIDLRPARLLDGLRPR